MRVFLNRRQFSFALISALVAPGASAFGSELSTSSVRPVQIRNVSNGEKTTLRLITRFGTVSNRSRQRLSRFTETESSTARPPLLHSKLLLMLQRVADRFPGSRIEIVSAHRPQHGGLRDEHTLGRALDFRIPGVAQEDLYEFIKTLPNCGTGNYPQSGFVHLDVRDEFATWIDHTHTHLDCSVKPIAPVQSDLESVQPIEFLSLWNNEKVWLQLVSESGAINNRNRQTLSRMAASKVQAARIPLLHPRLIAMLQKVSDNYPESRFELISGFRYGEKNWGSLHNQGRAIDFRLTGVDRADLYEFVGTLPKCGTGYYPNSVFVHLDVRDKKATWVDYSGPGEPSDYKKRPKA